jgi:DeoR family fructose operon transcriptional repressor
VISAGRRRRILDLANQRGVVSVRELCDALGVSDMTIRRDFRALEREGMLHRTHGGAVALSRPTFNYTHDERERLQREAKDAIGAAAAALVDPGDTLFLGSGTTVLALARHLRRVERLTIVTDSVAVLEQLVDAPTATLICTGGVFSRTTGSLLGPIAERTLAQLRVRKAFTGSTGVSPEGFSTTTIEEAAMQRQTIAAAGETYVLVDHTKFGKLSLARSARLADVAGVVTDGRTGCEARGWLRDAGLRLIVAGEEVGE